MPSKKMLVLTSLVMVNLVEQLTPQIRLEQGVLVGRVSPDNGRVLEYLGVPYSTANETNRYKAPFPPPKWKGIFYATNEHHRCPQMVAQRFRLGEEDCLKLNVYTPSHATPSSRLPVMVFIHGGAFGQGSGGRLIYDPVHFVTKDVIVVTINYRLGALGFLCLGLKDAPGNAGLKDQLAALKWVNKNILAFGGNPENVIIFGESAGGSSVAHLRLSKLTKGLFHKVIIQSGSALPVWSISGDPIGVASRYVENIGIFTKDRYELMKIFQNTDHFSMVKVKLPKKKGSIGRNPVWFVPCIETEIEGVERIIDAPPYEKLLSGDYNHVPAIHGYNDKEGIFLISGENDKLLKEKDETQGQHNIPSDISYEINRIELGKKVKYIYYKNKTLDRRNILELAEAYTDNYFAVPIVTEAEIISKTSREPQYNYLFKYSGMRNLLKIISGYPHEPGATHADDLFYIFKSNLHPYPVNEKDGAMISRLTTMWTNFAKYGDPTPALTNLLPVKWTPSNSSSLNFLHIDEQMSMKPLEWDERLRFWKETYAKFRRKFYEVGKNTPPEFYWI